ncbi:glycosyltransferase [Vibrio sinaloensis]|uniref:glycosyltransferase n=2 Tax=Photobacterium sp. (strain ATCC 43367) TaxID=379097 RepID=UPI002F40E07E
MNKKIIFYIGNFHYPSGNAAGKRVSGIISILINLGYHVVVFDTRKIAVESKGIVLDNEASNEYVTCYTMAYPQGILDWLKVSSLQEDLIRKFDEYKNVEAAIFYGSPRVSVFSNYLIKYFNKKNIVTISDVVDWLIVKTKNPIRDLVKKLDDYYQKTVLNNRFDKSICISYFLEDMYKEKIRDIIVIPPVMDSYSFNELGEKNREKTLFYAGNPFRSDMRKNDVATMKDRLDLIISHLCELKDEGVDNFVFQTYGFTKNELLSSVPYISDKVESLGRNIIFNGEVDNEYLVSQLINADFSVLFRDFKRDSVAGFPSKVAESIVNGIPVIVTDVGDISLYLENGKEILTSPPQDLISQKASLRSAILMSDQNISSMKEYARSNRSFVPENYLEDIRFFINS